MSKVVASYLVRVTLRELDAEGEPLEGDETRAPTLDALTAAITRGLEGDFPVEVNVTAERTDI